MVLDTGYDKFGQLLHSNLDNFLWKMSLPNTPSYNLNTDLQFYVRLWFHNGIGNILPNPFLTLVETDYGNFKRNYEFKDHAHYGLDKTTDEREERFKGEGIELGDKCFDLTPFVQSIQMPDIGPNADTKVDTLLGSMQVGSYSPYASDGGQEISFQVLDTQYSVLDAIFYPWMKMIGNPNWYDPNNAFQYHTTPYPICTIEIATPERRSPEPDGTEEEKLLTPYVYQFLGARPKRYQVPEINAADRSTLTRNLTMVCDLVIVDMNKDSLLSKHKTDTEAQADDMKPFTNHKTPVQKPDVSFYAPPAEPDPDPSPSEDDVAAAEADVNEAQNDRDTATSDANDQSGGGEPGQNNAAGPEPWESHAPVDPANDSQPSPPSSDTSPSSPADMPSVPSDSEPAVAASRPSIEGGSGESEGNNGDNGNSDGGNGSGEGGTGNDGGGDGGNGSGEGGDSSGNPSVVAGLPMKRQPVSVRDGEPLTVEDRVVLAIKQANDDWHAVVEQAKSCIRNAEDPLHGTILPQTVRNEVAQHFDELLVTPLIDNGPGVDSALTVRDKLSDLISAQTDTSLHHYQFHLTDARAIGNIIRTVQPEDPTQASHGNYGRVLTMREMLDRIHTKLPRMVTKLPDSSQVVPNVVESFFALKALEALDHFPNNSLTLHEEPMMDVWPMGVYLAPVHNALIKVLRLSQSVEAPVESYPFLFRYSRLRDDFTETEMFAALRDAMNLCDQERLERSLGTDADGNSVHIEQVSLWEIIDDNLNHTGTYWCKLWVVARDASKQIVRGNIVICKVNYMGTVLTDAVACEALTMRSLTPYMVISRRSFTKATSTFIFSEDDNSQIKVAGHSEADFNPLTAITPSEKWSLTREYEQVRGVRDGGEYDNLQPTNYVHIEEWPVKGDAEYNLTENGFYTLSTMDEFGTMTTTHYKVEAATAYEVYSKIEKEQRPVVPLHMGICLRDQHTASGDYDWLMIKRHNCWDGHSSNSDPYPTVHTTNAEEDMFEQYIPSSLDYVAQYRHHKVRWNEAKAEQAKLRQLNARVGARIAQVKEQFEELKTLVAGLVTEAQVKELMDIAGRMDEISRAYNVLIGIEIKQEASLVRFRQTTSSVAGQYNVTTDQDLPKRLSLADDLHLHTLSLSRMETELREMQIKQQELEDSYNRLRQAKQEKLDELADVMATVCNAVSDCVCDNWVSDRLWKTYSVVRSLFAHREDRRIQMERLIVFFDRRITQIEEALRDHPGNVTLRDLILDCDWKAWGDWTDEEGADVQEIRRTANKLAYVLRTKKLIPRLTNRLTKALKKRDRILAQLQESTTLMYDTKYAYAGYVPDDEQEPATAPLTKRAASGELEFLDKVITEYKSLTSPKVRVVSAEQVDPRSDMDYLDKVVGDYKSLTRPKQSVQKPTVKTDRKDPLEQVVRKYKSLIESRRAPRTHVSAPQTPTVAQKALDVVAQEYKSLTQPVTRAEVPAASTVSASAKSRLLEIYRALHDNFKDYTQAELENSLLLVLASGCLTSEEGHELQQSLIFTRRIVEHAKLLADRFHQESDQELKLIAAARDKCKAIQKSIAQLDKTNTRLLKKSAHGQLPRENYAEFRLNTLKKADLQQSLDRATATLDNLVGHYENQTLATLTRYTTELANARDDYDQVIHTIEDQIDFSGKLIVLCDALGLG